MLKISQTLALALIFTALVLIITAGLGLAASFGFCVVAITFGTTSLMLTVHNYAVAPVCGEAVWA